MNLSYLRSKKALSFADDPEESDPEDNTDESYPLNGSNAPEEPNADEPDAEEAQSPTVDLAPTGRANIGDRFKSIFDAANASPTGPANTNYQNYLNQGPPNVVPGKMNRLAAILGGASDGYFKGAGVGVKTARTILDGPQDSATRDFNNQAKVLQAGAALEDKETGRKASIAKTAMADVHNEENEQIARDKNDDLKKYHDAQSVIAAKKAADSGWRESTNKNDGSMVFTKMINGELKVVQGPKVGESIPEQTKREIDKFNAEESTRQKNRKEITGIEETGRNNRSTASIDAANERAANTNDRITNKPTTKTKDLSPAQLQTDRLNKMRGLAADPDMADNAEFFHRNKAGIVDGIQMPQSGYNPFNQRNAHKDKETYDALFETVYGKKPKAKE